VTVPTEEAVCQSHHVPEVAAHQEVSWASHLVEVDHKADTYHREEEAFCRSDHMDHEEVEEVEAGHTHEGDNRVAVLPHQGNSLDANHNDAWVVVVVALSFGSHRSHA
jgi:hypothetical protein